jgi:peptide/nickel transport system substrate-binding protein
MASGCRWVAAAIAIMATLGASDASLAQKKGGILRVYTNNSPASMSILEEATAAAVIPMMAVLNNLVMFDQHVKQNSLESIVPDLATGWSWSDDGKDLTFKLRQGVRWHDGKPFTAADVKCTWDMVIEASPQKFRVNPRKSSYRALEQITTNGDYEVTFHLKWPQPAFLMLLANGFSGVYPCHVPPAEMRQHPIGTGPFKFVEFRPNESIKLTRNPDYWKPGLPYLDGIEYTIIHDQATAILAFASGKVDMTFPYGLTIPLLKEVRSQVPQANCELTSTGVNRSLFVNRIAAPFDNADVRRALALAIDRKPFIDILTERQGEIGGVLQPPPEGLWGMPPDLLRELPGYAPDMLNNRAQARTIMQKLGYGSDKRLPVKISAQNTPYLSRSGADPDRSIEGDLH